MKKRTTLLLAFFATLLAFTLSTGFDLADEFGPTSPPVLVSQPCSNCHKESKSTFVLEGFQSEIISGGRYKLKVVGKRNANISNYDLAAFQITTTINGDGKLVPGKKEFDNLPPTIDVHYNDPDPGPLTENSGVKKIRFTDDGKAEWDIVWNVPEALPGTKITLKLEGVIANPDGNESTDYAAPKKYYTFTICDGCVPPAPTGLDLSCPDNIEVALAPGQAATNVSWTPPVPVTDCTSTLPVCTPSALPGFSKLGERNGKAYFISQKPATWEEGKSAAEANGGTLVILDEPGENEYVGGLLTLGQSVFIGLSDAAQEGTYRWVDGQVATSFNWDIGCPTISSANNNDFIALHGWSNGQWADYGGQIEKRYIIEVACAPVNGIDLKQVQGPPNGSAFQKGITTIAYEAYDACNQTSSCRFTVNVLPATNQNGCTHPTNVALGKNASQSSTRFDAAAGRANDENTSGNFWKDFSVSHTDWEKSPYWQTDLGEMHEIEKIRIWNRTDCCQEQLADLYLIASPDPFVSNDLQQALSQPGAVSVYFPGKVGVPSDLPITANARYVRVQLKNASFLSMAEVEVMGCLPGNVQGNGPISLQLSGDPNQLDGVALAWTAKALSPTDRFHLEHSSDGVHFSQLNSQAARKVASISVYQERDAQPKEGKNFYRVAHVQPNGSTTYSNTVIADVAQLPDFAIAPNPAQRLFYIYLEKYAGKSAIIKIADAKGIERKAIQMAEISPSPVEISLEGFREGLYFITVDISGRRPVTKKLMVGN